MYYKAWKNVKEVLEWFFNLFKWLGFFKYFLAVTKCFNGQKNLYFYVLSKLFYFINKTEGDGHGQLKLLK